MHTWLPDAHSQAPASICALLSGVETTTVLYVILRLFPVIGVAPGLDARPWFIGFGLVSVGVAALLLIQVRDFKRMFAFSTVEHMGIILVAAGFGGAEAHLGAAYQMTGHALAKSFCFFAAGMTVMAVGTQEIASVRGLIRSSPLAALALMAGGFAIAGAPPFAVFVSEIVILKAGVASGQYVSVALLAFFVVVAFCAITFHINRMVFGLPEAPTALRSPHRFPAWRRLLLPPSHCSSSASTCLTPCSACSWRQPPRWEVERSKWRCSTRPPKADLASMARRNSPITRGRGRLSLHSIATRKVAVSNAAALIWSTCASGSARTSALYSPR